MGNLKPGQLVEAALWILPAAFLYAWSFGFDREIEIYKFGATAWPRAILLLIVIAAVGQLASNRKTGGRDSSGSGGGGMLEAASDDGAAHASRDTAPGWYVSAFCLLALPFAYLLLPDWLGAWFAVDKAGLHTVKLACAGVLIAAYLAGARANPVGGMLALPVFFGALLQDFGFYSLAPLFAAGVMILMGERRPGRIALVTALIACLLLLLFVNLLYVGLPTGNLSPFYEIGAGLVNLLQ